MLQAQKKMVISIVGHLLFLILIVFFVCLPLVYMIGKLSDQYLSDKEKLVRLSQGDNLIKKLEKDLSDNQDKLDKIDTIFLDPDEIVGLMNDLEKIADKTNNVFKLQSISEPVKQIKETTAGEEEKQEKQKPMISFQLSLTGKYVDLIRFVANLEDTPYPPYRLIKIDDISIKGVLSESLPGLLNIAGPSLASNSVNSILNIKIYTQE